MGDQDPQAGCSLLYRKTPNNCGCDVIAEAQIHDRQPFRVELFSTPVHSFTIRFTMTVLVLQLEESGVKKTRSYAEGEEASDRRKRLIGSLRLVC